ncbi:MAG: hypothetical protein QOF57_1545 [Frankiaceae bacterium]|nr:hypothetical protein [Frankiaceae bacterium]
MTSYRLCGDETRTDPAPRRRRPRLGRPRRRSGGLHAFDHPRERGSRSVTRTIVGYDGDALVRAAAFDVRGPQPVGHDLLRDTCADGDADTHARNGDLDAHLDRAIDAASGSASDNEAAGPEPVADPTALPDPQALPNPIAHRVADAAAR